MTERVLKGGADHSEGRLFPLIAGVSSDEWSLGQPVERLTGDSGALVFGELEDLGGDLAVPEIGARDALEDAAK